MQTQKDDIRERVLKAAEQVFLKMGFAKASMRDIARLAGVSVANIYNYFHKGKDEIFRQIVSPLINELERTLYEHHDAQHAERYIDFLSNDTPEIIEEQTRDYISLMQLMHRYRPQMEMLFFKAQGTSLENFLDDFTERCSAQLVRFMQRAEELQSDVPPVASTFTYHLHTVWMFNVFCEIIKHRLSPEESERVVRDYIAFEYSGWRGLGRKLE